MIQVIRKTTHDKMFLISLGAALVSMLFSRPQVADIDWKTIFCLAALLALVQVYEYLEVLSFGAAWLVQKAHTQRFLVQVLILIAFFASMFLTNDAAIIAIVPILVLIARKIDLQLIVPVVLVNVAANLGSMVTPFGNPQNLFILNHFNLSFLAFIRMAWPIALASLFLLWFFSRRIPNKGVSRIKLPKIKLRWGKLILSIVATVIILGGIFSVLPSYVMLAAALIVIICVDPKIYQHIDYALLLTFIMFFITVGDIGRIPVVNEFMHTLGRGANGTYFSGILSSQLISNVPAVILLAPYTKMIHALFLGVNIGGLGTLVASLANLLAYKQYYSLVEEPNNDYFKTFLWINGTSLLILGLLGWLLVDYF